MTIIKFKEKQIEVDENGYLVNSEDWTKELANFLADKDGITLTYAHFEVINFLRDYYKKHQIAPMFKILVKEFGKVMGPDKGNTKYFYELYPKGGLPVKLACKHAGIPEPLGCGMT